jgi:uncharacterized protein YceH (UPF0502 family)
MRKGLLMLVPLGEASRLTRVNKSTLTRAIKAGRLSATRREDGSFVVDVSELERVYPIRPASDASSASIEKPRCATPEKPAPDACNASLEAQVASLQAKIEGLEAVLVEVRAARDLAQEQNRVLLATLPPPRRSWRWFWRR